MCRRKSLLNYFGEEYTEDNCGTCDNCLHPKTQFEGHEHLQMVLETIIAINQKFKADHVINILKGNVTAAIKSYKHNKLDTLEKVLKRISDSGTLLFARHWL
jgi:ATP-dependent DNA helicase RecQ